MWLTLDDATNSPLIGDMAPGWASRERLRRQCLSIGQRAAETFLAARGQGQTAVIAGFPWFTDWGRDTLIALPGLTQVLGDKTLPDRALTGLLGSGPLVPNRWTDVGETPEMNSVDASLWFVIVAARFILHGILTDVGQYLSIIDTILETYLHNTFDPHDSLLHADQPGQALTWMDARIGQEIITRRAEKPLEIQALWYNALKFRDALAVRLGHTPLYTRLANAVKFSVNQAFPHPSGGFRDTLENNDHSIRPNQIYAVGLPYPVAEFRHWHGIIHTVSQHLYRPFGLLTLSPQDPDYHPYYGPGLVGRDRAYHQGMAWPFLLGIFLDAVSRVNRLEAIQLTAQVQRWRDAHLYEAGLLSISEICEPDTGLPQGCPFQAWSVGELFRLGPVTHTK